MFDESDKVGAYVKQKNIGMKIDYSGKARQVLKTKANNREDDVGGNPTPTGGSEERDGATRAMRRIIQQKLLSGDELMPDEMRFLKNSDTGLYSKACAAQKARESLAQKLEEATTKEEASEAFLVASGLVNEAGIVARQKTALPIPPKEATVSSPSPSLKGSKPRTRWKLDLSNTHQKDSPAKTTTTMPTTKNAATKISADTIEAKKQTREIANRLVSEDTTGIEFIMGRALQATWAKFIQTQKYRELIGTTEHSIENLDPSNMTVATRFVSASRAYRNLPKARKGVLQQSFDSET